MMQEKSKLNINDLEAIESLIEQEITPEEADKISGGKFYGTDCPEDDYPPTRPNRLNNWQK